MERHDDEAILAALGAEPDGFALLYWRYAGEILDELARCTGDAARAGELCAEAFAVALDRAHRYDPARGPVADWLYAIARRLLDQAERRGAVAGGAQRRLGMAPFRLMGADGCDALSASDAGLRFMRELEEELVAAARFRAARRARRVLVPRRVLRRVLAGAAALVLVTVLAALTQNRAGEDRRITPAPSDAVVILRSMQRDAVCGGPAPGREPWAAEPRGLGVLERSQRKDDVLSAAALERLPLGSFDPAQTRRGGSLGALTTVHIVPSRAVSVEGHCGEAGRPGVCLVETRLRFRCFSIWEVGSGRALARIPLGLIVGLVPDGIAEVTLSARGRTVGAAVVDNLYEAQFDVPAGTRVRVALAPDG